MSGVDVAVVAGGVADGLPLAAQSMTVTSSGAGPGRRRWALLFGALAGLAARRRAAEPSGP